MEKAKWATSKGITSLVQQCTSIGKKSKFIAKKPGQLFEIRQSKKAIFFSERAYEFPPIAQNMHWTLPGEPKKVLKIEN